MTHRSTLQWVALAACAALSACSDNTAPAVVIAPLVSTPEHIVATLYCTANTRSGTIACDDTPALPGGIAADIILGGQHTYITLAGTAVFDNPTTPTSWTATITVKNQTVWPMGTVDAASATPGNPGVKVFFIQQPSNGVTIANADGTGTFTSAAQPFYLYSQGNGLSSAFLASGATSNSRAWTFNANGQTTFTFSVAISTTMPDEVGVLRVTSTASASGGYLTHVWGTSASDIFATGSDGDVQHYNGSSWSPQATPVLSTLSSVWGSSPSNVIAVGYSGVVLTYNGTSWTQSTTVNNPTSASPVDFYAMFGLSATDVYAGGQDTLLYRFNGATWNPVNTGLPNGRFISSVWALNASDVYIGGGGGSTGQGYLRHFNGSSWSTVNTGTANTANNVVNSIWGSSSSDIWAAGKGLIMHFDGTNWTSMSPTTAYLDPTNVNFYSVDGTGPNDVWFASFDGTRLHWDGTRLVAIANADVVATDGVLALNRQRAIFVGYGAGFTRTVLDYTR